MLPPEPGLYFMNPQNYYEGSAGNTRALPIGGKLRFGVRAFIMSDVLNPTYVCDKKLLGAKVASTARNTSCGGSRLGSHPLRRPHRPRRRAHAHRLTGDRGGGGESWRGVGWEPVTGRGDESRGLE
jgi:hypothetical protein